ncbi:MAG: DUF4114 domain-containing protein [Reyranella sp.]|nr:DUF4114 domain-containing protein [Reyranella sp.]
MAFNILLNSTFLDAYGNNLYSDAQYAAVSQDVGADAALASLFRSAQGQPATTVGAAPADAKVTVGLILSRQFDPTAPGEALSGNWAQRQAALADEAAVFARYGANPTQYGAVKTAVSNLVGDSALTSVPNGYVSSAEDRTIWVTLDRDQFKELFGRDLLQITYTVWDSKPPAGSTSGTGQYDQDSVYAWTGNLGIDDTIPAGITSLWIEQGAGFTSPVVRNSVLVPLPEGPVGIGNSSANKVPATPAAIAANYDFPLPGSVLTDPIAVVEPNIANPTALFNDLNAYRQAIGLAPITADQFKMVSGGGIGSAAVSGELALDISVVTDVVQNTTQLIYSMLGGTPFTAYQQIYFDTTRNPSVLTSSYSVAGQPTAASPFYSAWQQLFVDGALSGVTTHIAGGDQGGGADIANGIANVSNTHTSPFALIVGGTSIATLYSSMSDPTLSSLLSLAQQNDPATLFMLTAAGLKTLPSHLSAAAPSPANASTTLTALFESVWQSLSLTKNGNTLQGLFGANETGAGGIALNVPIPDYQSAFGVSSRTGTQRGVPDVSALSSGDAGYAVLNKDYANDVPGAPLITKNGGTSAATPLWASLTAQFNFIFGDQGLPKLGYYNDLLYNAAVINPGAFNDVQLGNNNNSYSSTDADTGYFNTNTMMNMVPTNQGQAATPGYDLASGLGTPNATLLARTLTWIAHDQTSYTGVPDLIDSDGAGGWTSGANQTLLVQTTAPIDGALVALDIGLSSMSFASGASGAFAWTSRLAQQVLQSDFDGSLAILFDKQAQGALTQSHISTGQELSIFIDSGATQATQASFSTSFGFADFSAGADSVRVARAVTVAETVGGANDETAVVRMRQVGTDSLAVTFYRVDDFSGSIGNLHPGDPGYQAALQARAYTIDGGGTQLNGPGYGQYAQAMLRHVNSGDLIAMQLTDKTTGAVYSAFSQANEFGTNGQKVGHLWSYGANTFGWEDTYGGGDRDYNDLVVQIDPTSSHGGGWLI